MFLQCGYLVYLSIWDCFNTKNSFEIPSSPNVSVADLQEIPIPIETSNTDNPDIRELQNLVAQEFPQLSESDNENDEIMN